MSGANTPSTSKRASGAGNRGRAQPVEEEALTMPTAPWAKLKTPVVV